MPTTRRRAREQDHATTEPVTTAEAETLQALLQEIRRMREEHARREDELASTLARRGASPLTAKSLR